MDSRAVDAADRLLELLCRVAQRGQNQGQGRHQRWGTGSASPSHQLGKAQFENVVRLAAERINAADMGILSILRDAFVLVEPEYQKAARTNQREVARLIKVDEAVHPEEAEQALEKMMERGEFVKDRIIIRANMTSGPDTIFGDGEMAWMP